MTTDLASLTDYLDTVSENVYSLLETVRGETTMSQEDQLSALDDIEGDLIMIRRIIEGAS